jgi:FkbM family methyltransferase
MAQAVPQSPFSQLGQDLFCALLTQEKREGFFVDVGASNGVALNNTYLLENTYGWRGICIEPSSQFQHLARNRRCHVDQSVLGRKMGQLVTFVEASTVNGADGSKQADEYAHFSGVKDSLGCYDVTGTEIQLCTYTLDAVLARHHAPPFIDFVTVDVEGHELEVLAEFGFNRYRIGILVLEHNFEEPKRTQLRDLLAKHGLELAAAVAWDDWYVHTAVHSVEEAARCAKQVSLQALTGADIATSFANRRERPTQSHDDHTPPPA